MTDGPARPLLTAVLHRARRIGGACVRGFPGPCPRRFNIAHVCCDVWAEAAPDKVAVTHLGADGTRSVWTYGDLKRASDRLAARWRRAV
jgi:hypothetical protein